MSVPRWLLLIALVFGIAGMHTLGHPEPAHGQTCGIIAGSGHSWGGPTLASPHDEDHHAGQRDENFPKLDPLAVCLAILASLVLLALSLTALRIRRPAVAGPSTRLGRGLSIARPPPKRTAVRLALLSVLRL